MTPHQIQLIQTSFATISAEPELTADLFYARLFKLEPELQNLFTTSSRVQGHKLMVVLGSVVANLENLAAIVPVLQELGRRHVSYGVKEQDYATVGEALLWTLKQILGGAHTSDVREAWTAAYGFIANTMSESDPSHLSEPKEANNRV